MKSLRPWSGEVRLSRPQRRERSTDALTPRLPLDPASAQQTFSWTGAAALSRAPQVERDVDRVGEAIADACEGLFPRWAGYCIHEDRLRGTIRGRRYRIRRGRFVGQVSVQLFASGSTYRRTVEQGPLKLRIDGRMRLEPPPPRPELPLASITLGVIIVCVAVMLVRLVGFGWTEILHYPSTSRFVDGVGLLVVGALVPLAVFMTKSVARHGAALPWAQVRSELRAWLRWPWSVGADRRRWISMQEHLARQLSTSTET